MKTRGDVLAWIVPAQQSGGHFVRRFAFSSKIIYNLDEKRIALDERRIHENV
jgi:hypothetical protein